MSVYSNAAFSRAHGCTPHAVAHPQPTFTCAARGASRLAMSSDANTRWPSCIPVHANYFRHPFMQDSPTYYFGDEVKSVDVCPRYNYTNVPYKFAAILLSYRCFCTPTPPSPPPRPPIAPLQQGPGGCAVAKGSGFDDGILRTFSQNLSMPLIGNAGFEVSNGTFRVTVPIRGDSQFVAIRAEVYGGAAGLNTWMAAVCSANGTNLVPAFAPRTVSSGSEANVTLTFTLDELAVTSCRRSQPQYVGLVIEMSSQQLVSTCTSRVRYSAASGFSSHAHFGMQLTHLVQQPRACALLLACCPHHSKASMARPCAPCSPSPHACEQRVHHYARLGVCVVACLLHVAAHYNTERIASRACGNIRAAYILWTAMRIPVLRHIR